MSRDLIVHQYLVPVLYVVSKDLVYLFIRVVKDCYCDVTFHLLITTNGRLLAIKALFGALPQQFNNLYFFSFSFLYICIRRIETSR